MSEHPTFDGWEARLVRPRVWEVTIQTGDGPRTITMQTTLLGRRIKGVSGPT